MQGELDFMADQLSKEEQLDPAAGMHHKGVVDVIDVPPDFEFPRQPPPREDRPTTLDVPQAPLLSGKKSTWPVAASTSIAIVTPAAVTWMARRARQARHNRFDRSLKHLEEGVGKLPLEHALHEVLNHVSLRQRATESQQLRSRIRLFIKEAGDVEGRCPWDIKGRNLRRLRKQSDKLSSLLATVERAAEEIELMRAVEGVLHSLRGGDSDSHQDDAQPHLGSPIAGICRKASIKHTSKFKRDLVDMVQRITQFFPKSQARTPTPKTLASGQQDEQSSAQDDEEGSLKIRLCTRVSNLLSGPTPCVFRNKLESLQKELSGLEKDAVNWLTLGLRRWNLDEVDKALKVLQALEFTDVVKSMQPRRESVESKRWELKRQLEEAQHNRDNEGCESLLRKACVKAETFYATDLDEYKSAKAELRRLQAARVEIQARRILVSHEIMADSWCNVRVDDSHGFTLLLPPCPDVADLKFLKDENVEEGGVVRRLALGPQAGHDALVADGENSDTDTQLWKNTQLLAPTGGHQLAMCANGKMVLPAQQQLVLLDSRRKAQAQFQGFITQFENEQNEKWAADRSEIENREERERYHADNMKQVEGRFELEKKRLDMEKKVRQRKDKDREIARKERAKERYRTRMSMLWSEDASFLWTLAIFNLVVSGAMFMEQLTINPSTLLEGIWSIVVAECRDGSESHVRTIYPFSTSLAPPLLADEPSSVSYGMVLKGDDLVSSPDDWSILEASEASSEAVDPYYIMDSLWWACSTVGSAAGSVIHMGFSSIGWFLGESLTLVSPGLQCEIMAALGMALWAISLLFSLRIATALGGNDSNPRSSIGRLVVLAVWVWGKFHEMLIHLSRDVLIPLSIAPMLALAYGVLLRYIERNRKLEGWSWNDWDVRPLVSRVLPTLISVPLAWYTATQMGREAQYE